MSRSRSEVTHPTSGCTLPRADIFTILLLFLAIGDPANPEDPRTVFVFAIEDLANLDVDSSCHVGTSPHVFIASNFACSVVSHALAYAIFVTVRVCRGHVADLVCGLTKIVHADAQTAEASHALMFIVRPPAPRPFSKPNQKTLRGVSTTPPRGCLLVFCFDCLPSACPGRAAIPKQNGTHSAKCCPVLLLGACCSDGGSSWEGLERRAAEFLFPQF